MRRAMVLRGFDGDPLREEALQAALARLLEVFPEHLAKPRPPTWFDADDLAENARFDAILRAHKKDRLDLPIQALRAVGAPYHGFAMMQPRRLAWFAPSLLASWLARAPGAGEAPFGAADIEAMIGDDQTWTDDEGAMLERFFEAALDAALATALPPADPSKDVRPFEDGVRVWSLHAPSVPLDVLRVAKAFRMWLDPLVARWAQTPSTLAVDHLLEAVFDPTAAAKHWLSYEVVADRLGEAFFDATGERQLRLSKAEATVRRNVRRRQDEAWLG